MTSNLFAYIYDFLSVLFAEETVREKLDSVILFGSVAKNLHDKKSDIDLFFHTKDKSYNQDIENSIKKALRSFDIKSEKTWSLKGITRPIHFIAGSLADETWKGLRDEIISYGIVLYGGYKEIPGDIRHYLLFTYSLANLSRKNKMRFIRTLFGYSLKKSRKNYVHQGLLEKKGGVKLSSNAILIRQEDNLGIKALFTRFKVKYRIMEVWLRA